MYGSGPGDGFLTEDRGAEFKCRDKSFGLLVPGMSFLVPGKEASAISGARIRAWDASAASAIRIGLQASMEAARPVAVQPPGWRHRRLG